MSASNKNLFFRNTSCSVQRLTSFAFGRDFSTTFEPKLTLQILTRPKISLPI